MKSVNLKFNKQHEYEGKIYEAGKTYSIPEERGLVSRWLKRGCEESNDKVSVPLDPKVEAKKQVVAPKSLSNKTGPAGQKNQKIVEPPVPPQDEKEEPQKDAPQTEKEGASDNEL